MHDLAFFFFKEKMSISILHIFKDIPRYFEIFQYKSNTSLVKIFCNVLVKKIRVSFQNSNRNFSFYKLNSFLWLL